jgi:hypothetical protein
MTTAHGPGISDPGVLMTAICQSAIRIATEVNGSKRAFMAPKPQLSRIRIAEQ